MPRLHSIGNIHIRVYPGDTRKHRMPHFHAVTPDAAMVISLPELHVIAGLIRNWEAVVAWAELEDNLNRLMDEWDRGNPTALIRRPRR